jgi:hypothetical protein
MVLLQSVNSSNIDYIEYRDIKYFSKFDYRLRLKIPCVSYTWFCKTANDLDDRINGNVKYSYFKIPKHKLDTVIENRYALKEVINYQILKKQKKNFATRVEGDTIAFFSDDLQFLNDITSKLGSNYKLDICKAETSGFVGVKYFVRNPKHKYRVYLKSKRVADTLHDELNQLFKRTKSLYPSPALKAWTKTKTHRYGPWYFRWTSSMHFIDYDDESVLSYLALTHGEILGKKYKLEKRQDTI